MNVSGILGRVSTDPSSRVGDPGVLGLLDELGWGVEEMSADGESGDEGVLMVVCDMRSMMGPLH